MALPAFVIPLLKIVGSAAAGAMANKAVQQDQIGQGMDMSSNPGDQAMLQSSIQDLVKNRNQQQPMQFEPLTYDLIRRNR
jgi:hypothetical protein